MHLCSKPSRPTWKPPVSAAIRTTVTRFNSARWPALERDLQYVSNNTARVRLDAILARHYILLPKLDPKTRLYDRDEVNDALDKLPVAMNECTRTELLDFLVKLGRLLPTN